MYFNVDAVPTPVNELFPAQLIQAPRVVVSLKGANTITISAYQYLYFNVDTVPTPVNELFPAQLIQASCVVILLKGANTITINAY